LTICASDRAALVVCCRSVVAAVRSSSGFVALGAAREATLMDAWLEERVNSELQKPHHTGPQLAELRGKQRTRYAFAPLRQRTLGKTQRKQEGSASPASESASCGGGLGG
jgi:hypothetical protein